MSAFKILTGKALKNAIAGFGKLSATYAEKTHQLAYSALNHVEEHHDAIYVNALFAATPLNYRGAIVKWSTAFGKVTFDATESTFTYAKTKTSDMPAALEVSPADYVKDSKTKPPRAFDEVKQLESIVKLFGEKGASAKVIKALKGVLRLAKGEGEEIAANVVPAAKVIKARKSKAAAKSKAAPAAAANAA